MGLINIAEDMVFFLKNFLAATGGYVLGTESYSFTKAEGIYICIQSQFFHSVVVMLKYL